MMEMAGIAYAGAGIKRGNRGGRCAKQARKEQEDEDEDEDEDERQRGKVMLDLVVRNLSKREGRRCCEK
jgi:ribosomal protein L12E/L44/L45/RPP1/RPP2